MIISRLELEKYTFFKLHAEQAFEGSFGSFLHKEIPQAGIFQNALSKTTIDNLAQEIRKNKIKSKCVIFDFEGIEYLQVNQNIYFKEKILDYLKSKKIQLSNITNKIINDLGFSHLIKNIEAEQKTIIINDPENQEVTLTTLQAFNTLFKNKLKDNYLDETTKFHRSSPVYITKYIDIKKFITIDRAFIIYALYNLSFSMIKQKEYRDWNIEKNEKEIVLFSQNMNSSFIASILSSFLQLDVMLIDHVGPINKIYSNFENRIDRNKKYIVVSDVVCLGTEVKIAKNIIEFSGAEYIGNVSIIRVNTLKNEDLKYTDVDSIYVIEKDNNDMGYSIRTALDF
jgi:hypothetical protein